MSDKLVRLLNRLAVGLGTPTALTVSKLASEGRWRELQQLRCAPHDYTDPESFWANSVPIELLRKCKLDLGVDTEKAAVRTFYECERQCCATNARLHRYLPEWGGFGLTPSEERIAEFFRAFRKEISMIVGPLPERLVPRFSNGATVSNKSCEASLPDKLTGHPTMYALTRDLTPFIWETRWGNVMRECGWHPKVVRGNHFFTVAKDSEKDRGCGKEALINVCLQLSVGTHFREQLRRTLGLDLLHLQEVHRGLAQLGSLFDNRATIDMSNASDTVAKLLVKLGFPNDWYQLLDSLRAPLTRVKRRWVLLEKFSSMGNGFTFELETIIFLALARVVVRHEGGDPDQCSCYGDDLIIPAPYTRSVLAVLRYCGFTPNQKKTFGEGPFRESCGGDFFRGVPVRAHNLETEPMEPQEWIALANSLRRICHGIPSRWDAMRPAWRYCLDQIPLHIRRCRGPEHLGDIVIHDEPEYWSTRWSEVRPNGKFRQIETWSPVQFSYELERWATSVQLAACSLTGGLVSRRDNVTGYKAKWLTLDYTSEWAPPPPLIR